MNQWIMHSPLYIADLSFSVPTSIHLQVSNSYVHTQNNEADISLCIIDIDKSVIHEVKKHVRVSSKIDTAVDKAFSKSS